VIKRPRFQHRFTSLRFRPATWRQNLQIRNRGREDVSAATQTACHSEPVAGTRKWLVAQMAAEMLTISIAKWIT